MATDYIAASSGQDTPTLIVTTEALWNAYETLLQPQARYNFTERGVPLVDGGFKALMFRGTPVIQDEYCTAGFMYTLNERYLDVVTLKHPKYPTDKMGFTVTKLREPTDQDGQVGYILWYGDLVCTQPRRQAVMRGLS